MVTVSEEMLSNVISPDSLLDSQKSSSSAIIEYPAFESQMSASQNSQYPSSLELFSQNGSACSAPLPIAHLSKSHCKPTSDLGGHPRIMKDKKHYMKYLSAGPLSDTSRGCSQPIAQAVVSKSSFEDWKTEKSTEQMIKKLESTMNIILNNTNELTKSVCTLQASFNKTTEHQSNELQSLSTQANSVQENFEQLKSENNDNKLLINKLFDEVRELKKGIAKRDKLLEIMHKEIVELKSGKILTESLKSAFQVVVKEFFTTETLKKLFDNQRPCQATPHSENTKYYDNDDEQALETHDHQTRETVPLSHQEQVPVVPDISSHQQISAYGGQTSNSSFNSPASEWASDFSKSPGQKRTYSQRITISRKISPAISPVVSTGQRQYGTWGGDTSSSDHDTIEVTQLASFTRKVRRKPKGTNLSEEQNQNAAICGSWQQNGYKKDYSKQNSCHSTQAVAPVGRFKRSTEARKRRILCDSNDAELLQISASIRQQQMNRQLK